MIDPKNGLVPDATGLTERIASLESELAQVKAERDGYRSLLLRVLPEGDTAGWPSSQELAATADRARPLQEILQAIASKHGVSLTDELN